MDARFMIEKPDNVQATVKLTMTVREWCELRDQLAEVKPERPSIDNMYGVASQDHVADLRDSITELLSKVREVYYAEQKL